MNKKQINPTRTRLLIIASFFVICLLAFAILLYNAQVIHGDEYWAQSVASNATIETVPASRGIITDRNGNVLVSNRTTYTLKFSETSFSSDDELNAAILSLIHLCQKNNTSWTDTLPLAKEYPFSYTIDLTNSNINKLIERLKDNSITYSDVYGVSIDSTELLTKIRNYFHIDKKYSDTEARLISGVRYELFLCDIAGADYVFSEDVSVEIISQVSDGHYKGVTTGTASARVYNTTYAAHILGRLSRIYQEDWSSYKDLGYSMDALVGKSGVEEAFESYLHGTNGTRLITTDKNGKTTSELYTSEPSPGDTVALTIDINLQAVAEESLAKTIESKSSNDKVSRGGAVAVIEVGSGDVLALASYPTYDLTNFDEIYDDLLKDASLPMYNRAVYGTYAPGSTFKMCTAVAGLESGKITPTTTITDRGIYRYYSYPQPRCWIYNSTGGTHGSINVTKAITVSCNYFFYETGRITGIDTLDSYADQFGLGRSTGIEIGDSSGVLASPEYAESIGTEWTDGQTITAAIGQSYNLFTPIQLANYIATLTGNGEHYAAHLLKSVRSYDNSNLIYVYDEEPENIVKMSDSTVNAVLTGMHNLTTGSLSGVYSKCVVPAGAKTGTAQTSNELSNAVFVSFAPYDDPQIAIAVVVEQGGGGSTLASIAVDIINAYFSIDSSESTIIGENTLLK